MSALTRQIEHIAAALAARAKRRSIMLREDAVRWYYMRFAKINGAEIGPHMLRAKNRNRSALLADLAILTGQNAGWIELHAIIEYGIYKRLLTTDEAAKQIEAARAIIERKGEA